MEKERIMEYRKEPEKEMRKVRQLADEIHFFCPKIKQGVGFYNQSPTGLVAELTGYLPEGNFKSSGHYIIDWDEEVNGERNDYVPVTPELSLVTSTKKVADGEAGHTVITVMVSDEVMASLVSQMEKPTIDEKGNELYEVPGKVRSLLSLNKEYLNDKNDIYNNYNNDREYKADEDRGIKM